MPRRWDRTRHGPDSGLWTVDFGLWTLDCGLLSSRCDRAARDPGLRIHHAAQFGRGHGVRRAQGSCENSAAHGADPRRSVRSAAAARRHHQAGDEGTSAAEVGRSDSLRAGPDHFRRNGVHRLCRRAVRRRDHVLRSARSTCAPPGCRRERGDPVGVRRRVDGRLRHRARRLELEQQILASRRAAVVSADDQLRALIRHGARGGAAARGLDVDSRDRRRAVGNMVRIHSPLVRVVCSR